MKTNIFVFTLSIVIAMSARAELKWEQTQVELHPAAGDKQAIGHFKYQNTGGKAVHFKSVHSSCGCTAAQSQKEQVGPGEKGEITATFNIGDRTGTQVKTVTVETDEAANTVTVLTLKAVLPEQLEIKPTLVYWNGGEAPQPKTIVVHPGKDFRVGALHVNSSNPEFSTKVARDAKTGDFKIDIARANTTRAAASMITIQPDNSPKVFSATARVMNGPATQ
jgi:ribonuclease BN (tRNA processing enzyme)